MLKKIEINLGKVCNSRCCFCLDGGEKGKFITFEVLKNEIKKGKENGYKSIGFIGGEPTIYPNLIKAVSFAKNEGYETIAIQTNGFKLSDKEYAEKLIDAGLTRVAMSFHSHLKSIEDKLCNVSGGFQKKLDAVKNLVELREKKKLKDNISVNPLVMKPTLNRLTRIVQFFINNGINDVRFNLIRPAGFSKGNKNLVPQLESIKSQLENLVLQNEQEWKIKITFGDFPLCILPWQMMVSKDIFTRYFCDNYDQPTFNILFNYNNFDIKDEFEWKARRKQDLKEYVEICNNCPLELRCEGIWKGYIDIYGDSDFKIPFWI